MGFTGKKTESEINSPYPVIIKGFRGEPAHMRAINNENNIITVTRIDGNTSISLKSKYVYYYDKDVFRELKAAFEAGDDAVLEEEWQKMESICSS